MFSKFLKKKVQDIDLTRSSIFEAHFLTDHMVSNFFPYKQRYVRDPTLNLKMWVNLGKK